MTSPCNKPILENEEPKNKGIMRNPSDNGMVFITEVLKRKHTNSYVKRQTGNGKLFPTLLSSDPLSIRDRNCSEKERGHDNFIGTKKDTQIHICLERGNAIFVNDYNIAAGRQIDASSMALSEREEISRRNLLLPRSTSNRNSSPINFLKPEDIFTPVFQNQESPKENIEASHGKGIHDIYLLSVSSAEETILSKDSVGYMDPIVKRRIKAPNRQRWALKDTSGVNTETITVYGPTRTQGDDCKNKGAFENLFAECTESLTQQDNERIQRNQTSKNAISATSQKLSRRRGSCSSHPARSAKEDKVRMRRNKKKWNRHVGSPDQLGFVHSRIYRYFTPLHPLHLLSLTIPFHSTPSTPLQPGSTLSTPLHSNPCSPPHLLVSSSPTSVNFTSLFSLHSTPPYFNLI